MPSTPFWVSTSSTRSRCHPMQSVGSKRAVLSLLLDLLRSFAGSRSVESKPRNSRGQEVHLLSKLKPSPKLSAKCYLLLVKTTSSSLTTTGLPRVFFLDRSALFLASLPDAEKFISYLWNAHNYGMARPHHVTIYLSFVIVLCILRHIFTTVCIHSVGGRLPRGWGQLRQLRQCPPGLVCAGHGGKLPHGRRPLLHAKAPGELGCPVRQLTLAFWSKTIPIPNGIYCHGKVLIQPRGFSCTHQ